MTVWKECLVIGDPETGASAKTVVGESSGKDGNVITYDGQKPSWIKRRLDRWKSNTGLVAATVAISVYLVIAAFFATIYVLTVARMQTEVYNITVVRNGYQVFLTLECDRSQADILRGCQHSYCVPSETLYDLEENIVAHKDLKHKKCYIRPAKSKEFRREYEDIKSLLSVTMYLSKELELPRQKTRPNISVHMRALSRPLPPEVVVSLAGQRIDSFCFGLPVHWLVLHKSREDKSSNVGAQSNQTSEKKHGRKTRISCIDSSYYKIFIHHHRKGKKH